MLVSGRQLNNLFACSIAIVYKQQAKYTEALSVHHEVLEIRLKTFGPEHLDVARTQNKCAHMHVYMHPSMCTSAALRSSTRNKASFLRPLSSPTSLLQQRKKCSAASTWKLPRQRFLVFQHCCDICSYHFYLCRSTLRTCWMNRASLKKHLSCSMKHLLSSRRALAWTTHSWPRPTTSK